MKLVWIITVSLITITTSSAQKKECAALRIKLSEQNCSVPKPGDEDKLLPCTHLCLRKILPARNCEKYSHCCIHNCRCVMKGAGIIEVPKDYLVPEVNVKSAVPDNEPADLIPGCIPTTTTTTTTTKPCGPKQKRVDGKCKPMKKPPSPKKPTKPCGPNKKRVDGKCVLVKTSPKTTPTTTPAKTTTKPCGPNKKRVNGKCKPKPCGSNQKRVNGKCVPVKSPPSPTTPTTKTTKPCGPNKKKVNGKCMPKNTPSTFKSCGPNEKRVKKKNRVTCEPITKPPTTKKTTTCKPASSFGNLFASRFGALLGGFGFGAFTATSNCD